MSLVGATALRQTPRPSGCFDLEFDPSSRRAVGRSRRRKGSRRRRAARRRPSRISIAAADRSPSRAADASRTSSSIYHQHPAECGEEEPLERLIKRRSKNFEIHFYINHDSAFCVVLFLLLLVILSQHQKIMGLPVELHLPLHTIRLFVRISE